MKPMLLRFRKSNGDSVRTARSLPFLLPCALALSLTGNLAGCGKWVEISDESPLESAEGETAPDNSSDGSPRTGDDTRGETIVAGLPPGSVAATDSFQTEGGIGKADLVWVIDNSASMRDEAAHVRTNFLNFLDSVQARADLKVALLSNAARSNTGITLPESAGADGHLQIDTFVASTNALALAASASCPPASTAAQANGNGATARVCDEILPDAPTGQTVERASEVDAIRGRLSGFFRASAKRLYVFVSDDNPKGVTDANFLKGVARHSGGAAPVVYAFRGVASRPGCAIANPGLAYDALAQQTTAKVFDICETDWTANFATLADAVTDAAEVPFVLSKFNPVSVLSVTLDGKEVPADKYRLEGSRLLVASGVVKSPGQTLNVQYAHRQP